ncbi:hypothetical protein WJS89_05475 [Sphingomicrobium sp. XHP0235]|uniref:hypothetical protein n=1 Tax=Sphingomicrobium aquimarinum TaxID=3133971 RepID=UPI0031FE65EF
MLPVQLYFTILAIVCAFAIWRGGVEERIVAVTSIVASLGSLWIIPPIDLRYGRTEMGVMAIDLAVLFVYIALALRSRRYWPLWVAGIQLTTSLSHAIKAVNVDLLPAAYAVAAQFWVYPILLILFVATLRRRKTGDRRPPSGAAPA